jgi:hypothetical protein
LNRLIGGGSQDFQHVLLTRTGMVVELKHDNLSIVWRPDLGRNAFRVKLGDLAIDPPEPAGGTYSGPKTGETSAQNQNALNLILPEFPKSVGS